MSLLLLRSGKSRAAWASGDPVLICDTEFENGFEAGVSVYAAPLPQLVQVFAEHCAGNGLGVKGGFVVDFDCVGRQVDSAPLKKWPFSFTAQAHHEIAFVDRADLEQFIAQTILPSLTSRWHDIERKDLKGYVRGRVMQADNEWGSFHVTGQNAREWYKLAGRIP